MPTPQLTEHLTTLRRDAVSLVPCRHPECAAYRQSLIEQIGIVVRLIGDVAPKNGKTGTRYPR